MKCSFDKYTKGDTTIFHGDCLEVLPHFQTTQLISYLPTPPIISAKSLGDSKIPGHPKRTTRSGVFNGWKYVSKSSSLLAAFTLWPAHKLCLIWISGYVTA